MPGLHAALSASKAKQWIACPPSARINQRLDDRFGEQSSPYAAEGTKAHALAELKLRLYLGEINKFVFDTQIKTLGDIPAEMERATDYYVDIVEEKHLAALNKCPDAKLFVEIRLNFNDWVPEGFGTGDAVIVSDSGLEVCDLKYGKGVPVSAVENPQARCYGLGALAEFGDVYAFKEIRNTIIQPRLDSVTEETLTREELLAWGESIRPIARLAWEGKGEFAPGEHCKFCNAHGICRARINQLLSLMAETGFDSPDVLSDDLIGEIYLKLPIMKECIKDIEAYALSQAKRGQEFRGLKLVRGRKGARAFRDAEEARIKLGRAGYEPEQFMTEPALKSVSDIEKLLGKQLFSALLGEDVVQADGALTLVSADDKRPEYASADADFSDLV